MLEAKTPTSEPPKPKGKHLFTKETGRANGAKGNALLKAKSFNANSAVTHDAEYYTFKRYLTGSTQIMLERTFLSYVKVKSYDNRSVIASTFERLFKIWCHLTGTPAPGNLRPQDLMKRVEKLGLKSFAQSVMIDAPSPVEDSAIQPLPEPTPETLSIDDPKADPNADPKANAELTDELTAEAEPETTTDYARATCQDVLDTKESLKSPEPDRGDGQGAGGGR